ncbi:hypothetical protein JHN63_23645 [Streptomyces sp. MBT65]|uniref:P-loop NTPase n=1 Tax=Streptomyces sp. MBT65 TaxID=1488395 RepID=UPI0019091379|nr:hypothetical protein [Streptomyces sp. MBT65]MBK3576745.1 hypothetical protein [Streptomyces sp. MBT65]
MSAPFHFLSFSPLVRQDAALESMRTLHASGHRLDGIFALGTSAVAPRQVSPSETGDFLDRVMVECLDTGDYQLPPVICVPWRHDVKALGPGQGMLVKALTRYWSDTEKGLWRGDEDDVVAALRDMPFKDFLAWADTRTDFPGWQSGVLPAEGAVRIEADGRSLGIVVANTVFRMATPGGTSDLATCTADQLNSAVDGDFAEWAGANDLSVVLAGHTAALPASLASIVPRALLLAPEGEPTGSVLGERWLVPARGVTRQHRLLRMETVGAAAPKVRDLAAPSAERSIPLPSARRSRRGSAGSAQREQGASVGYDEQAALDAFYQQIGTGRMILVAVSGIHPEGGPIDTDVLTQRLTQTVYGEVLEPQPTTQEIWETARGQLSSRQMEEHVAELRMDETHFAQGAHRILNAPWWRIYDLTATDILSSVLRHDPKVAETSTFVNAMLRKPLARIATVEAVAMHGDPSTARTLAFGVPTDDDIASRALWFRKLKAELLCRPSVFMAASPSSRSLWQALALAQPQADSESFPRFVVTGPGSAADRARIRQTGMVHIQALPHEFATQRFQAGLEPLKQGKRRLADVHVGTRKGLGIKLVSALVDSAPAGSVEFLKGQDPTWGDVKDGYAAKLSITERIRAAAQPAESGKHALVLVEGRAGSGKTSALMQYAYELHKAGRTVAWIDRETMDPIPNLKAQAQNLSAEAVFVDDVDIFGRLGASLLQELSNGGKKLVVAAIRTTRADELDASFRPAKVSADEPLKDEDLGHIVDVLHQHGLPGILKQHKLQHQKINKLRELCDRGLLAAMIQVVTGKRFEDKVVSEYHQLNTRQAAVYSTVCVFESAIVFKKRGIEQADLLQIVSGPVAPDPAFQTAINRLVDKRILNRAPDGTVRCRQRTIADTVVDTVLKKDPGRLGAVIEFLLKFYAQYSAEIRDNDDPYRRIMVRLLNHSLMVSLPLDVGRVRAIYDTVHELLCDNFHYWLQRGEFELERGDLGIAENHLETAQGCEGGGTDHFVLTAWSAIRLRRSTITPGDGNLLDRALEAIHRLEEVTRRHGGASPHSFAVIAKRGTEWLEACEASLSADQVDDIVRRILVVLGHGRRFCRDNYQFMLIADEFEPQLNRLLERSRGIPL